MTAACVFFRDERFFVTTSANGDKRLCDADSKVQMEEEARHS
jgi:hypothetical protein